MPASKALRLNRRLIPEHQHNEGHSIHAALGFAAFLLALSSCWRDGAVPLVSSFDQFFVEALCCRQKH
jgi:hypothetical protein